MVTVVVELRSWTRWASALWRGLTASGLAAVAGSTRKDRHKPAIDSTCEARNTGAILRPGRSKSRYIYICLLCISAISCIKSCLSSMLLMLTIQKQYTCPQNQFVQCDARLPSRSANTVDANSCFHQMACCRRGLARTSPATVADLRRGSLYLHDNWISGACSREVYRSD